MNEHTQIAAILRTVGSPRLIQILAECAEECADTMAHLEKNRRAEAFGQAGQLLASAVALLVAAEEPNSSGQVICTLADAADEASAEPRR